MNNNTIIIDIGNNAKEIAEYSFDYGGQKGIIIRIYNDGIRIIICKKSDIIVETYLQQQNVHEIIKKSIWLYTFTNKRYCNFNNYSFTYNDRLIISKEESLIYSLIEEEVDISNINCQEVITEIIEKPRTKYSWRVGVCEYYIIGKSCKYDYNKFVYYWLSFNSIMQSFKSRMIKKDIEMLKELANNNNLDYINLSEKQRNNVFNSIYLNQSDEKIVKNINYILKSEKYNYKIKNLNDFLLIQLSYYLRCKYFHASKTIPIIACKDDKELFRIKKCNDLLDIFLLNYLNGKIKNKQNDEK